MAASEKERVEKYQEATGMDQGQEAVSKLNIVEPKGEKK